VSDDERRAAERRLRAKLLCARREAAGLCLRCPQPATHGILCQRHRERQRAAYRPTGQRVGRRRQPLGDRWAELARAGQTPAQIARAEGTTTGRVLCALAARGLWQRTKRQT